MNTIYRIVWNAATGKWVVASELAKGRKKKSSLKNAMLSLAVIGAMAGVAAPRAYAADVDMPSCVAGEDPHETGCVPTSSEQLMTPFFADGGGNDNGFTTSVAIGQGAVTGNSNAVAIGLNATANNIANVAIGHGANTTGSNAIAMGYNATANGSYSLSLGGGSSATAARATAVGTDSVASGGSAVALGNGATASTNNSVAIGNGASVTVGSFSNALGAGAQVTGNNSNAVGNAAVATATGTNAFGNGAAARAQGALALGHVATTDAQNSVVIGSQATLSASATGSVALGSGATTSRANVVAVGNGTTSNRQIVNLAAGTQDTDAVNVSQLKGTLSTIGGGATVGSDGSIVPPSLTVGGNTYNNVAAALGDVDGRVIKNAGDITVIDGRVTKNEGDIVNLKNGIGAATRYFKANGLNDGTDDAVATGDKAVAIGANAKGVGTNSVALGSGAQARFGNGIAIGAGSSSNATNAVAIGTQSVAFTDAVAMGNGAKANNVNDVAIGSAASATMNSTAVGKGTMALSGSTALGQGAVAMGASSVALGSGSSATLANTVSVGTTAAGGQRQIVNLAAGTAGTDAVNVTQLRDEIGKASAGDTRYFKADGAMDGSDDAVNTGSRSVAMGAGSQATAANAVALGAGSLADRANTVSVGSTGNERQITNVAEGTEDTDAVNVGQLKKAGLVGGDGSTLDAVVYDPGSNRGSVTFGGLGGTKLTNVMAGIVSATSTDAVNGSQLWILQDQVVKLGDRVTNVENNGAGGNGPAPLPTPVPDSGRDPAFAATGDGGPASATGKDSVAAGTGASATADNSVAIGAGSVADRADTVSVGSAGAERQIANVAAGTQRTDAANWGQVQDALATANRYTDDRFDGVNRRIGEVQRQANRGIAASAALINVTPYMPGKTVLNAGVANYRGESALGVGVSRWNDTGRVNFNAGMSAAAGDSPIFRMGVGVVLGD